MWYLCLPPAPSQDPSLAPILSDVALASHTGTQTPFLSVASDLEVMQECSWEGVCLHAQGRGAKVSEA